MHSICIHMFAHIFTPQEDDPPGVPETGLFNQLAQSPELRMHPIQSDHLLLRYPGEGHGDGHQKGGTLLGKPVENHLNSISILRIS